MPSWKEVNPYSGRDIEEDAPANAVAGGGVSMPPDAMMNKKKKLIDGRTKVYRKHRSKLEASRTKRLEKLQKNDPYVESILNHMKEFTADENL